MYPAHASAYTCTRESRSTTPLSLLLTALFNGCFANCALYSKYTCVVHSFPLPYCVPFKYPIDLLSMYSHIYVYVRIIIKTTK